MAVVSRRDFNYDFKREDPVKDSIKSKTVDEEAHGLVRGERALHYGPPHTNFQVIAGMWNQYMLPRLQKLLDREDPRDMYDLEHFLNENDVSNLMTLLKLAREASGQGYHRDSTVDAIGYQLIKEVLNDLTPEEFMKEMRAEHEQPSGLAALEDVLGPLDTMPNR